MFSHVPLGTALRNAGHQVMMTVSLDELIPVVAGVGLPVVRITDPNVSAREIIARDSRLMQIPEDPIAREQQSGRWYARLEAVTLDALQAFTQDWHPDVIIGGMSSYAAPLLAKRLGVPYVRHAWDIHDPKLLDLGATEELQAELAELGLDSLPEPDMMIEITPPSLRPSGASSAQMMRWIPGNTQCRLESWMYKRGAGARIGVTIGTGVASYNQYDFLQAIVENVKAVDAEVVVPVTDDALVVLKDRLTDVRAAWVPLDILAPTCDVLVHQTGGSTMMTALSYGVPQVLIPDPSLHRANAMARRLVEAGAAISLTPEQATSEAIAKSCQEIISDPRYAAAAGALAEEIATLPLPSEVARRVEWVVHEYAGRHD
ncbi:glycosyltransferase [Micromonospora nigra]|uniref:glycosyltransferase n=1 Tax=Micromonospora nigra TaxID=145857 RepID=UPI00316AE321